MKHFLLIPILLFVTAASSQNITTFAFDGTPGYGTMGDGGQALASPYPTTCSYLVFDRAGNMYMSQRYTSSVRKISNTGLVSTFAGGNGAGFSGDGGLATAAQLDFLTQGEGGLACDAAGNLYISDLNNNRVRKVDVSTGIITTVAGSSQGGYYGDGGPATSAALLEPMGLAFDYSGNLYINDAGNNRIRKVDISGIITTVAGSGSIFYSGDSGLATYAGLWPYGGIAVDYNYLYIAERSRVRKVDLASGIITTLAGTDSMGYNGDEIASDTAELNFSEYVAADVQGNVYIADAGNARVRKVDPQGVIHTVAGTGVINGAFADNILATAANISAGSIALDSCGNLYINDMNNKRIRKVTFPTCGNLSASSCVSSSFSIYPNPTTSTITITSNNKIKQVTITDITGREVLYSTENTIDVSTLVSGVYLVRVWDVNGGSRTEKIIKQ